jgi:FHA domain
VVAAMSSVNNPPASARFGDWREDVQRSSVEAFAARHRGLFLLLYEPRADFMFSTTDFETSFVMMAEAARTGQCELSVMPVVKAPHRPADEAPILVGRSNRCDIVLRHSSVSKLHAVILATAPDGYTVEDAGSHNGTHVGDRILPPNTKVPIGPNDIVIFGTVPVRVLDAAGLYEALSLLAGLSPRP